MIFDIQQCDSLIEIFTITQLPTFSWQTNSDEVANKHKGSMFYFQARLAEYLRNYILDVGSQIFAKSTLKIRTILRTFEFKLS